jgi:GNAT superfamily N-acetyltransferase
MEYVIRKCNKNDISKVTHVVTISWNETYKCLVPDEVLEGLKTNEDERTNKSLKKFENGEYQQLVLEIDNEIVGFSRYGKSNDDSFINCGEIYAFYIINKYHGLGLGRKMFEKTIEELKKMGFDKMIIACLKENPTNEFYKHMGGKYIKDGIFERLQLKENIYYYDL